VVSLAAARETGRVAGGLLASVGLADLCARSVDGYVDAAARLAADSGRRAALRADLRQRMRTGTSMNGGETTANLEKAYKAMWDNLFR
jgi:predicted O-linked N-acetylglucosamine transferase (SPINDLY family)